MQPRAPHCPAFIVWFLIFWQIPAFSQLSVLPNAYAHNDYWHTRPFYEAHQNGFTHLEVDIFVRNGRLLVAHTLPLMKRQRTLDRLYLEPMLCHVKSRQNKPPMALDTMVLMIDIKSNGERTFYVLKELLKKYSSIITSYENGCLVRRNVTIVLTGNRPLPLLRSNENNFFFIDEHLKQINQDTEFSHLYAIASCKYSKTMTWKGEGTIPAEEKNALRELVEKAHSQGKKVRLWASPENEAVWTELLNCGVDLINTDRLEELRRFFVDREKPRVVLVAQP